MKLLSSRRALIALVMGAGIALSPFPHERVLAQQGAEQQDKPPHEVEVTEVERQDIELERSYSSLLRSDNEVALVARITGVLQERHFEPGQMVEEGQRLYSIEPDVYQATVNQRDADLQSARAELSRAQRDAERFERLLSQNSVSRQEYDQALAEMQVARASVAQAEASLARAQIDLAYSDVKAPVAGMISLSEVNVGNLVTPGTALTTITPLDPLEVRFQLPQRDAFELRRQMNDGTELADIRVLLDIAGHESPLEGYMDYLGSRVSQGTSTVQGNANVDNPDGQVLPGQFVRVRIDGLKRYDVIAVPEITVTQGLMGPQVFVLDEDNKARARTVELGELAGPWQVIDGGLEPGERIIVGDPAGIEPGRTIEPRAFDGDADNLVENIEEEKEQAEQEAQQEAEGAQNDSQGEGSDAGGDDAS
ncbi:MAG: efflux RND transporter periplasmic adaptor subunit [Halomonas sp.]